MGSATYGKGSTVNPRPAQLATFGGRARPVRSAVRPSALDVTGGLYEDGPMNEVDQFHLGIAQKLRKVAEDPRLGPVGQKHLQLAKHFEGLVAQQQPKESSNT